MKAIPMKLALCIFLVTGCKAVPPFQNAGELIASPGVQELFEDPKVDTVYADGSNVKCRQIRRVGTHIHSRLCMTVEEWESRERALAQTKDQIRFGPCNAGEQTHPHGGSTMGGVCGGDGRTSGPR